MTAELETRHRYFILAAIFTAILLHYRLFTNPYLEWDEIVYIYLSEKMSWTFSGYSTQGSFIDAKLPANVYSAEIFHHPPLVPYLIKIFTIPMVSILAAKSLNLILIIASIYFLFRLALSLSGFAGAMLTTAFWVFCPIFNLESNLVHLDFPETVFILAGTWYLHQYQEGGRMRHLVLSGVGYALAMLTKFTAPIFILLPIILTFAQKSFFRERKAALLYFSLISLGFSWWIVVLVKYGSLLPVEFIGNEAGKVFHSAYLDAVRARNWYHIWIYFFAFFPLLAIYAVRLGKDLATVVSRQETFCDDSSSTRFLILLNIASIIAVVGFNIANAFSNKIWVFRHIMPVFPVIYLTTAHAMTRGWIHQNVILRKSAVLSASITLVLMGSSTYYTVRNPLNLKVIPSLFEWVSGLKSYFI